MFSLCIFFFTLPLTQQKHDSVVLLGGEEIYNGIMIPLCYLE